jgi:hypothetical protein
MPYAVLKNNFFLGITICARDFLYHFCYVCFVLLPPFSLQFRDIQLVVTVLSHCCNSPTDSGEAKVESHASSETWPCQATLLAEPGSQQYQCDRENTIQLMTEISLQAPRMPHGVTKSQQAKHASNSDDSGPIVCRLMGLPVTAGCDTAWDRTQVCSDALDHCATREAVISATFVW